MNPSLQIPTARKPTTPHPPRVSWRGLGLALVLACLAVLACSSAPAFAEGGSCPNEAIRKEQGVTRLPDCRAYEMVTPAYKAGYQVQLQRFASDGEHVILGSVGAFGDSLASGGGIEGDFYSSTRSADGWQLSSLMAPQSEFVDQGLVPGTAEANDGMSLWYERTPGQSARVEELYVRSASGEYTRVGTNTPTAETSTTTNFIELADSAKAATSDFQHVVLQAHGLPGDNGNHWPFDKTTGAHTLYEYSGTNSERPVLVAASGAKVKEGDEEELIAVCGSELGSGERSSMYNALSSNGETIFFSVLPCGSAPKTEEVYARLHGAKISPAPAESVDVGASECSEECGGEEAGGRNFEGASENGEKVFFTSTQKLTNDASDLTAGGSATGEGKPDCAESASGCNLYEYDFALNAGHRLVLVAGGADNLRGVASIAEDGSRIYYVAEGVVPGSGENEFHRAPVGGEPNLYVYDTDTGATSFIATLSQADHEDWQRPFSRPVQVTGAGGRFLLFSSAAPGVTPDEPGKEQPVVQLFEYDAQTGELVRVTQGEDGWNENGNGVSASVKPTYQPGQNADYKNTTNELHISNDGKTVVFETVGELSPLAHAASSAPPSSPESSLGCPSVYEFRSEGRIAAGVVHLLSDGRDVTVHKGPACGDEFLAMDESGNNILFSTTDSLLSSDVDGGQEDIYDARVDGGFPSAVATTPKCEGEGCQGTSSNPPGSTPPGTSSQAPEAPVAPAAATPASTVTKKTVKCTKGKKLSHGKCVKAKGKKKAKKANNGRRASR
jgi:hypothetical protein